MYNETLGGSLYTCFINIMKCADLEQMCRLKSSCPFPFPRSLISPAFGRCRHNSGRFPAPRSPPT
ncbi:hypothetical protein HanPSC8_Chr09g0362751 [Helianthus annuus]|nr:hypothetical protein HanPSC8_Chr09g0362751 [Helianthus annuus]